MARDILAIPISSVGAERVFNIGRDVIHYRRGNMNAKTIRDVMIAKDRNRGKWVAEYTDSYRKRVAPYFDSEGQVSIDDAIAQAAEFRSTSVIIV
jgi:hypothetical protein